MAVGSSCCRCRWSEPANHEPLDAPSPFWSWMKKRTGADAKLTCSRAGNTSKLATLQRQMSLQFLTRSASALYLQTASWP